MMYNAGGFEKAEELGAVNYIGSDEYLAGKAGGEYFAANGATNVVCVNTVPGAANLEARCKGVIDGMTGAGQAAKQLPLPPTSFGNPTAVAEAIKAALLQDDTIDGVITISQADADSAANGIMQAGGAERVKLGGFDMNQTILDRIAGGTQLFAIDQQPYLQGYLATSLLHSHSSGSRSRRPDPDRSRHRRRLQCRADDGRRGAGRPLKPPDPTVRPASRAGRTPPPS